jgi:hypothetical protein
LIHDTFVCLLCGEPKLTAHPPFGGSIGSIIRHRRPTAADAFNSQPRNADDLGVRYWADRTLSGDLLPVG